MKYEQIETHRASLNYTGGRTELTPSQQIYIYSIYIREMRFQIRPDKSSINHVVYKQELWQKGWTRRLMEFADRNLAKFQTRYILYIHEVLEWK